MASPQRASQRNRSTRAFSQIEDPAMLRSLERPMTPPSNRLSSPTAGKTVEIRRLVSPSRSPERDATARTPPSTPPPLSSRPVASGKPPMASKIASPNSSTGTSTTTAASPPSHTERARTRESQVATAAAADLPIRDTSEWRETANRLSQRVKELELENFRLKASGSSGNLRELSRSSVAAPPPRTFAGGEMSALLSAAKAAEAEDALQYQSGSSSSSGDCPASATAAKKRGTILKSKSYAAELGHTGFTVAEAALASHRSRSKRTASTAAAAAPPQLAVAAGVNNPLVDKLRAGYWTGNSVKSSFSCNNLADMDRRDIAVEKLNLLLPPPPVATAPAAASTPLPPAPIPKKKMSPATPPLVEKANSTNTRGNRDVAALMNSFSRGKGSFHRAGSGSSSNLVLDNDFGATHQQQLAIATSFRAPEAMLRRSSSSFQSVVDTVVDDDDTSVSELSEAYAPSSQQHRITSPRSLREADFLANASLASSRGSAAAPKPKTLMKRPNSTDVRMWVGTWNMGAADPFADGNGILDEQRSGAMLQHLLPHGYQLYVLGVQEGVNENVYHAVEAYLNRNERGTRYYRVELRNSNCLLVNKNHPMDAVIDAVHGRGDGAFMGTKFTGLAVFVSADVQDKVKLIRVGVHKFNITSGSKGGVAVALLIRNTTMVFVNCHLDARNDTYRREQVRNLNANLGKIMGHYSFDLTEQFHHVVWMGDMNYRIVHLDPQMVLHMLAEGRNLELHDKFDGLLNDRRTSGIFEGFAEPNKFPDFYPTYKKLPKRGFVNESLASWPTLVYRVLYKEPFYKGGKVKKRVPGWCDRILVHSLLVSDSKLLPEKVESPFDDAPSWIDNYRSVNHGTGMDVSDHSPVFATFVLSFPCLGKDKSGAKLSPHRVSRRSNRSHSTFSDGKPAPEFRQQSATGSYFDQPKVVRHINSVRPVSTVLIVSNMQLYWNDKALVPKKTRVVAPLVGEDLKQCDVIGERCQEAFALNLSLNALIQHSRPLEQLHMLVWVKNDSIVGHCTLSLKRIARQDEGGEVRFRVPLYNNSTRLYHEGHPLLVVFSVRAKTFAKQGMEVERTPRSPSLVSHWVKSRVFSRSLEARSAAQSRVCRVESSSARLARVRRMSEKKTELEPQQQGLAPGNEGLFELIPDGLPVLKDSEVKHKLLQWNLNETLQLLRFRVKAKITPDVEEAFVTQFFHDTHVQSALSVRVCALRTYGGPRGKKLIDLCLVLATTTTIAAARGAVRIQCRRLHVSVTSLSFLDRLVPAGVVSESGALRRCLDEVYDGATASDLLKEALVSAEAEEALLAGANWFSRDEDQREFIFQLFRALVIGGAMCQSDESVQPYERVVRALYRALVSVKKHASDRAALDVTSRVYAVEDARVFPAACVARFSTCFVVLDPRKCWLMVWRHAFQPFW